MKKNKKKSKVKYLSIVFVLLFVFVAWGMAYYFNNYGSSLCSIDDISFVDNSDSKDFCNSNSQYSSNMLKKAISNTNEYYAVECNFSISMININIK